MRIKKEPWTGCFNPRAPCGARPSRIPVINGPKVFQSTRPVRGATCTSRTSISSTPFQSTRPVRGATHPRMEAGGSDRVSIHAPRAGRDLSKLDKLSTSNVSIHAPRAGRDKIRIIRVGFQKSFNPRAPCGARPSTLSITSSWSMFQSTRPVRGATFSVWTIRRAICCFNPRAPCGARPPPHTHAYSRRSFNPRAPCGARQMEIFGRGGAKLFQSTRPVRGATVEGGNYEYYCNSFNPRAPCGARR